MANKVVSEQHMPLSELRKHLPLKRDVRSLRNWITKGVKVPGRGERRVRMEAVWIAGDIHSSVPAYQRFVAAQNE